MKRPVRSEDGTYTIKGKKYKELFGSREQVHNGTAYKTPGGLTIHDIIMNKHGRIVSAKKYKTAKKERRLEKYGYYAKKGKFGYVKNGKSMKSFTKKISKRRHTKKRHMKGGDRAEEDNAEKEEGENENESKQDNE